MVSKDVFLLTGTYTTEEDTEGPTIKFFGRTSDGDAVCLSINGFKPYCHVLKQFEGMDKMLSGIPYVTKVEPIELNVSAKDKKAFFKVTTKVPQDVAQLRRDLEARGVPVYAADIVFPLRYMYDMDLGPYVSVTGIEAMGDGPVKYIQVHEIKRIEPFEVGLSVMSIDIENSMVNPEKNLLCIGWVFVGVDEREERGVIYGPEQEMLLSLLSIIQQKDPDIITGYNINQYDLPHLLRRFEAFHVSPTIGRSNHLPKARYVKKDEGEDEYEDADIERWVMDGRVVVDAWKVARYTWSPRRETLKYVAHTYGIGEKMDVDASKIDEEWKKNPRKVMEYCQQDSMLALGIIIKAHTMQQALALAGISLLPLAQCVSPHQSWIVDSLLIRKFDRQMWAVPCMNYGKGKEKKIKGAHVVSPTAGLYHWVTLLDFRAMYPSIIRENNLCYSTYLETTEGFSPHRTLMSPSFAVFLKPSEKAGIVPAVMEELLQKREHFKKLYKEQGKPEWDRLQNAVKITMNSFYGLMTSQFYRFTNRKIGESITAYAREEITSLLKKLEKSHKILYGDTDSLFLILGTPGNDLENIVANAKNVADENSHGNMSIEVAGVFRRWFTHGKKKRYFGSMIWPKEELYVRGYETRRGDSFDYQTEVMMELMTNLVINGMPPTEACIVTSKQVRALLKGKVDPEKLVITKSVADEGEYQHPERIMGVRAVRKYKDYGFRWIPGTKMSWVVTNHCQQPMEVEPWVPERVVKPIPDLTYYADRLIKSVRDITVTFGFDETGLRSSTTPTRLEAFNEPTG